jgi:hypothetical protein
MAFTRADLDKCECETEIRFSEKLIERLEFHLKQQIYSPFFIARATATQIGYQYAGGYYWIVGRKNGMVHLRPRLWNEQGRRRYFAEQSQLNKTARSSGRRSRMRLLSWLMMASAISRLVS